ncbi:retrovirus-related pol polyprotein from transposon TNT 1-94, partial [Tanacetum coccineum]
LLTQSYKSHLPQTNNQLRTSSNARNKATVQDDKVVVQDVCGRYNANNKGRPFQRNNTRGNVVAGNAGGQNRGGNVTNFDDDMDDPPEKDLALNVDHIFEADQCDAFDSDVDEAPNIQTIFMVNLSSEDPIYDEVGLSYDSNTPFEVQDHDTFIDHMDDRSCDPYNANDVTGLLEQNERLRAEIEKVKQHYKEMFESIKITRTSNNEQTSSLLTQIEDLKAQFEGNLKVATRSSVKTKVLTPGMYAIDVKPIPHPLKNNRSAHLNYINHLKESVEIVMEIVEEARRAVSEEEDWGRVLLRQISEVTEWLSQCEAYIAEINVLGPRLFAVEPLGVDLVVDMTLSALLGDNIYNFGELLITSVQDSPVSWLYNLLEAFNSGDLVHFTTRECEIEPP